LGTFRFLLALAVVVSHAGGLWGRRYMDGLMAVQCFYMVSGFLISLILSGKYDTSTSSGLRLFYTNRALRIFVPYWTFFVVIAAVQAFCGWGPPVELVRHWPEMDLLTRVYLVATNLFIVGQEWMMWLVYDHGSLLPVWSSDRAVPHLNIFFVIPQAWSMSLELMFYALAPFLVRRHWLVLLTYIVASYVGRKLLMVYGFDGSGFVYRFFPIELGLFLAGVLAHRAYAFFKARWGTVSLAFAGSVTATLIAMMFIMRWWDIWESHRFYALVVIALPSLFVVSQRSALDRWLGELSYPIYLCHLGVLEIGGVIAAAAFGPVQDRDMLMLVLIIATVVVSAAYVYWIDAPFDRWRQRRVARAVPEALAPPSLAPVLESR
jgi:peptidoglycan/LPS O-acetylase OafA/YrhL